MRRPPFRLGTVQQPPCEKIYCPNGHWKVLRGKQHIDEYGRVAFDPKEEQIYHEGKTKDGFYRTVVGPSFGNNGVILAKTNSNQRDALGRLLSCRYTEQKPMLIVEKLLAEANDRVDTGPELKNLWKTVDEADDKAATFETLLGDKAREMELEMRMLQDENMYSPSKLEWLRGISRASEHIHLDGYVDMILYANDHVSDPHPKRELRERCWEELQNALGRKGKHVLDRLWLTEVLYKMKPDEISKVGKWARMIGDLGVAASLQGFGCTDILKRIMCTPADGKYYHMYRGFRIYVAKQPDIKLMTEIFDELINPTDLGTFAIFSDDACAGIRFPDGVKNGNLDISGCDSSHGPRAFYGLAEFAPNDLKKDLLTCIDQLKLQMRVEDMGSRKSKKKVILKHKEDDPVLFSGSTLTTVTNGGANVNIALQSIDDFHDGRLVDMEGIQLSAIKVGYYVTFEAAERPCDLQFLKHSPVKNDEGEYLPMPNKGILFRASGTWKGDVPGDKNLSVSLRGFGAQKLLLNGMYPHIKTPLVEAMKKQVAGYSTNVRLERYVEKHMPYSVTNADPTLPKSKLSDKDRSMNVPNSSVVERYRVPEHYLHELTGFIQATTPDHQYSTPFVNAVLLVDYKLNCQLFDGKIVS